MSNYGASYGNNNKLHRSPSGKVSYSPGNWKSYISNDLLQYKDNRASRDSLSNRALSPSNSINQISYTPQRELREEKQKKKEDMMRRVKEIQSRVLPLIENQNHNKLEDDFGWQTKLQQRISKLQTAVDAMQKEMEIRMEKQIVELEKKFAQRITEMEEKISS